MEQLINTPARLLPGQKRNPRVVYHNEEEFRAWQERFAAKVEQTEKVFAARKQFAHAGE